MAENKDLKELASQLLSTLSSIKSNANDIFRVTKYNITSLVGETKGSLSDYPDAVKAVNGTNDALINAQNIAKDVEEKLYSVPGTTSDSQSSAAAEDIAEINDGGLFHIEGASENSELQGADLTTQDINELRQAINTLVDASTNTIKETEKIIPASSMKGIEDGWGVETPYNEIKDNFSSTSNNYKKTESTRISQGQANNYIEKSKSLEQNRPLTAEESRRASEMTGARWEGYATRKTEDYEKNTNNITTQSLSADMQAKNNDLIARRYQGQAFAALSKEEKIEHLEQGAKKREALLAQSSRDAENAFLNRAKQGNAITPEQQKHRAVAASQTAENRFLNRAKQGNAITPEQQKERRVAASQAASLNSELNRDAARAANYAATQKQASLNSETNNDAEKAFLNRAKQGNAITPEQQRERAVTATSRATTEGIAKESAFLAQAKNTATKSNAQSVKKYQAKRADDYVKKVVSSGGTAEQAKNNLNKVSKLYASGDKKKIKNFEKFVATENAKKQAAASAAARWAAMTPQQKAYVTAVEKEKAAAAARWAAMTPQQKAYVTAVEKNNASRVKPAITISQSARNNRTTPPPIPSTSVRLGQSKIRAM